MLLFENLELIIANFWEILVIGNLQWKLFQKCTQLLYCSVLSLGGNVNTRRMSEPDMGSIFHIKKINEIFWSYETIMWIIKVIKF